MRPCRLGICEYVLKADIETLPTQVRDQYLFNFTIGRFYPNAPICN